SKPRCGLIHRPKCDIDAEQVKDKRARERAKEAGRAKGQPRTAPPRLVEGGVVQGWKAALSELALVYPDRINTYL
ncbi:MAG: hypothetical protein ACOYBY_18680, partial [Dermatophilaceae bacterium]